MKYATILATAAALTLGGIGVATAGDNYEPRTQAEQYQAPSKAMQHNARARQAHAEVMSTNAPGPEVAVGAGAILAVALLLAL